MHARMHHRTAAPGHRRWPPLLVVSSAATLASAPATPPPTSRPTIRATTPTPRWSPRSRRPGDAHPDIVAISSIGKSYQGRDIWVAKVSDNVADGRARARGPVRFAPPRPRAPLARADPGDPALADRGLRHGRRGSPTSSNIARDLDRLRGQPRRRRVRPDRLALPRLAQEPPAERRARPRSAPTSTATTATSWGCCGGSSGSKSASTRIAAEARSPRPRRAAIRDFMASRRVGGAPADQDRHHVPHGRRADPVAVRLHEDGRPVGHDRRRPRRARRARQEDGRDQRLHADAVEQPVRHRRRRDRLGVRQRAHLHVHVRALSEPQPGQLDRALLPARRADRAADRTQQGRHPDAHRGAPAARTASIGKAKANCGPLYDDFETLRRLDHQPARDRHRGRAARGSAAIPSTTARQAGTVPSGSHALVTGRLAGATAKSYDVDGGVTTVRSAPVALPATVGPLTFRYYLAHSSNSSSRRLLPGLRRGRRTASGRSCARRSAPRTPTCRAGRRPRSR